jgi:glycosyltransferase involved in cell wall biosynthesis
MPPVDDPASLFYVGALGHYYQLHEAVRAVEQVPGAALTICTAEALWQKEGDEYTPLMTSGATRVVHASGAQLEPFYAASALGCLFMAPIEYREFAAPMKLYEYLGHGRPIIATEGTLLRELREDPTRYLTVAARADEVRRENTWAARATQAVAALTVG